MYSRTIFLRSRFLYLRSPGQVLTEAGLLDYMSSQDVMTSERWQRLRDLFERAREVEIGSREAFLRSAAPDDPGLREEVQRLCEAHEQAGDFIDKPAIVPSAILHAPASPFPDPETFIGNTLRERYEIVSLLGEGGFGRVYLARDRNVRGRTVAVKLLLKARTSRWFEKRYQQELESLARIHHPGVVEVLDSGETTDGIPYLVLQLIKGCSLREVLSSGPLPLRRVSRIAGQIGEALSVVHKAGIYHRDLKPENIQICDVGTERERVVLLDFGIARLHEGNETATNTQVAGSPGYMAPEQILGQASAASDIYAMGMIVFEMLAGRPFHEIEGDDLPEVSAPRLLAKLSPGLPRDICVAIVKSLAIHPRDRFQEAAEFGAALTIAPAEPPRRRSWPVLLALVLPLALALTWLLQDRHTPRAELRYSLFQRNSGGITMVPPDRAFREGDQIRLRLHALQGGYLYLVSESIDSGSTSSRFDWLYPGGAQKSAWIPALQTVDVPSSPEHWTEFDNTKGLEKIWIVWGTKPLPELETFTRFADPPYQGEVRDAPAALRLRNFLSASSRIEPSFDDRRESVFLSSQSDRIVSQLVLRHE